MDIDFIGAFVVENKKPITSPQVCESLYDFLQKTFAKNKAVEKEKLEFGHANEIFTRFATGQALSVSEVLKMRRGQQKALQEVLTQYVIFLTMFNNLLFPPDFLSETDEATLGPNVLAYFVEHLWPFPQMLPWSGQRK